MKIAFLISSLSGGGAEKVLCILANRLAKENNQVYVISLEKRKQFYRLDNLVQLYKFDNKSKGKIKEMICDFRDISKVIKEIEPEITISFLLRTNLLVLLTNIFNKRRIIVCDRNNPLKEHSPNLFKICNILYRRADQIVVQTNQIKAFYDKKLQRKIMVQENPLDTEELYKQLENKKIEKENIIISIGRLEPQKDFFTLIKAFKMVSSKFPDWRVNIFGIGYMKEELQQLIDSMELSNRVILQGITYEPFYELSRSKIFVLSTNYEGFPNVLCEAMEAGLLCISSDCVSGPKELIINGENGWLFEIGNIRQLSDLLECNMLCYEDKIIAKARQTVLRLHLENNINGWKDIIESVHKRCLK